MSIIAFEGLDGVGKTSAAEAVAAALGGIVATHQRFLTPHWLAERKYVNAGNDVDARFYYFLQLNHRQMAIARGAAQHDFDAALNSSIYRTVATHRVLGSVAARQYVIEPGLIPDHTFYLDLPEQARAQRMVKRDGAVVHPSRWDELLFDRQDDLRQEYGTFGLTHLDASKSPEALVGMVKATIQV